MVNDNFVPVGVAYMADVEEEMERQAQIYERDDNFGRLN